MPSAIQYAGLRKIPLRTTSSSSMTTTIMPRMVSSVYSGSIGGAPLCTRAFENVQHRGNAFVAEQRTQRDDDEEHDFFYRDDPQLETRGELRAVCPVVAGNAEQIPGTERHNYQQDRGEEQR